MIGKEVWILLWGVENCPLIDKEDAVNSRAARDGERVRHCRNVRTVGTHQTSSELFRCRTENELLLVLEINVICNVGYVRLTAEKVFYLLIFELCYCYCLHYARSRQVHESRRNV